MGRLSPCVVALTVLIVKVNEQSPSEQKAARGVPENMTKHERKNKPVFS